MDGPDRRVMSIFPFSLPESKYVYLGKCNADPLTQAFHMWIGLVSFHSLAVLELLQHEFDKPTSLQLAINHAVIKQP